MCHKHFKADDILWEASAVCPKTGRILTSPLSKPILAENAIPCVFPNCASYLSSNPGPSRVEPDRKRSRLESEAVRKATEESIRSHTSYIDRISVTNLSELKNKINVLTIPDGWCSVIQETQIIFMYIDVCVQPHCMIYVVIEENMSSKVYSKGVLLQFKFNDVNSGKITSTNEVDSILTQVHMFIKGDDCGNKVKGTANEIVLGLIEEFTFEEHNPTFQFIKSQLQLCLLPKHRREYNRNFIVLCSIFHLISPHAYKFIRNHSHLILPHVNTLNTVCSNLNGSPILEQNPTYFLEYIKHKAQTFEKHEKYVILMVDEIHIKPYMDYKGGNVVGSSADNSTLASSAQVFMIQTILSSRKEVVHILPVSKITADSLHSIISKVIVGLDSIGLFVLAVVTDNNAVNSKAMSKFSSPPELKIQYCNPASPDKPLFYLIDSVHLFKCVRNNWLNQKTNDREFVFPDFDDFSKENVASFKTIRDLFEIEGGKLLKYGYGLTVKALWPTSFERQNVKFVCQLFNDNIANSVLVLGEKYNLVSYVSTAQFLKIITTWWHIVNVKTPFKGVRYNNKFQEPLTDKSDDERKAFLIKFVDWLEHWHGLGLNYGKLSKQTHTALLHTTRCLLKLVEFCSQELKWSYLLPGKFQTDPLEARFGQYRQLAGGQYHISVRQIFEIEKKIRILSTIELPISDGRKIVVNDFVEDEIIMDHDYCATASSQTFTGELNVTQSDLDSTCSDVSILTYIGGYCCHSLMKKLNCECCAEFLLLNDINLRCDHHNLIDSLDRGGLKYPTEVAVNLVTYTYVIVRKMLEPEKERKFLSLNNHRKYVTDVTMRIILAADEFIEFSNECRNHTKEFLYRNIIWKCTNILLNNYCKARNNAHSMSGGSTRKTIIFSK